MNILVIGAGAIGSLVGAKLALADHDVMLVGRPRFAAAVSERGLRLRDRTGDRIVNGISAATSIAEAFENRATYAFAVMAVKSYDTAKAVVELQQATGHRASPAVVTLQNGVGNEERIADALGPACVIAGVIATPVSTLGPAYIQVEKQDYGMGLSRWHPAVSSVAFDAAQSALTEAEFTVTEYADAVAMKWTKLLMNIVGNASCAILGMPPNELFAEKDLAELEIEAWREALHALNAAGIRPVNFGSYPMSLLVPLIRAMPVAVLHRALRKTVGGARGGKMPSLYIDLESGRSNSEVSWLNGAVVRKGNEVQTPTPVNRMLSDVLTRLVESPEERSVWRRNSARLLSTAEEYRAAKDARAR